MRVEDVARVSVKRERRRYMEREKGHRKQAFLSMQRLSSPSMFDRPLVSHTFMSSRRKILRPTPTHLRSRLQSTLEQNVLSAASGFVFLILEWAARFRRFIDADRVLERKINFRLLATLHRQDVFTLSTQHSGVVCGQKKVKEITQHLPSDLFLILRSQRQLS